MELAVILAAGCGARMQGLMGELPKGFLPIGETTLVERSIMLLQGAGITEIIIVTGYQAEMFDRLAAEHTAIRTVYNPYYRSRGTAYSLVCAMKEVQRPFLLLESDLVYTCNALSEIIRSPHANAMLVTELADRGDEYYVGVQDGRITGISRQAEDLENVIGEMVGISKLTPQAAEAMFLWEAQMGQNDPEIGYECALLGIAPQIGLMAHQAAPGLMWAEVDDGSMYESAKRIFAEIRAAEND